MSSEILQTTSLGKRPDTKYHLNGGSFQQDALASRKGKFAKSAALSKGFQYAAFYLDTRPGVRHLHIARRKLPAEQWVDIEFTDYEQVLDDGHNVVSLGISQDGVIHLAWDLHSSAFKYRCSLGDVTSAPDKVGWSASLFSSITPSLPGLGRLIPLPARVSKQQGIRS